MRHEGIRTNTIFTVNLIIVFTFVLFVINGQPLENKLSIRPLYCTVLLNFISNTCTRCIQLNWIELGLLSHRHISGHLGTHRIEDFVSRSHLQWKKYETLKQNLHTCWKIELQMFHLFNPFPVASYDILGSSSGIIL